jgi:hypothetical protein
MGAKAVGWKNESKKESTDRAGSSVARLEATTGWDRGGSRLVRVLRRYVHLLLGLLFTSFGRLVRDMLLQLG